MNVNHDATLIYHIQILFRNDIHWKVHSLTAGSGWGGGEPVMISQILSQRLRHVDVLCKSYARYSTTQATMSLYKIQQSFSLPDKMHYVIISMLKILRHAPGFLWAAFQACLRCLEIWQGDTQSPPWPLFFSLPIFFLSQAAMFVISLIFLPFLNSQFKQIEQMTSISWNYSFTNK